MRIIPWAWMLPLMAALPLAPARGDILILVDGSIREGLVLEESPEAVTLEVRHGGLKGKVRIRRSEIAHLQRQELKPDPADQRAQSLEIAASALKGSEAAKLWTELGDFQAARQGFSSQARAAWRRACAEDPDFAPARQRLGQRKTPEGWVEADLERQRPAHVVDDLLIQPAGPGTPGTEPVPPAGSGELKIGPRQAEEAPPAPLAGQDRTREGDRERLRRVEEALEARERLQLRHGEALLSRFGYYLPYGDLYIASRPAAWGPQVVGGVGLGSGDTEVFVGTVGYVPGYGESGWRDSRLCAGYAPRAWSPGVVYRNRDFGFTFGTSLSGFTSYGYGCGYPNYGCGTGYGAGWGFHWSGGSKNFRYDLHLGGR